MYQMHNNIDYGCPIKDNYNQSSKKNFKDIRMDEWIQSTNTFLMHSLYM